LVTSTILPTSAHDSKIVELNKLKGICVRADELERIDVSKAIKEIASYGYNAIFVLAKTPEGFVVFDSKNFPVLVNNLDEIVKSAKENNLKVYAYFPIIMDKTFLTKYPQEKMDNLGYENNTYYVSLLSKTYIEYVKLFIKELLKYDVDGIVFDYIRYPNGSYDFSKAFVSLGKSQGINMDYVMDVARKTFIKPADWKTMFVLYDNLDKDIVSWVNLRERVLKDVAKELSNYAKSIKSNIEVGAFLVSRGYRFDKITSNTPIKKTYAYQKVNFAYFGDTFLNILDFIIPMVYLSSLDETPDYVEFVSNKIKSLTNNSLKFYIGVNPDSISINDTETEIYYSYLNSKGVVLFRHPLFVMGKATINSEIEEGKTVTFEISNSKGNKITSQTIFNDYLIPPAKSEVVINEFYKFYNLVFEVGSKNFLVNNKTMSMDVSPIIKDSRAFIPIRFFSEALGMEVSYIKDTKEVVIENGFLKLKIGSDEYYLNNEKRTMDVKPFIENSRTFVPIRFVMESFNFKVDWNENSKTINISGILKID